MYWYLVQWSDTSVWLLSIVGKHLIRCLPLICKHCLKLRKAAWWMFSLLDPRMEQDVIMNCVFVVTLFSTKLALAAISREQSQAVCWVYHLNVHFLMIKHSESASHWIPHIGRLGRSVQSWDFGFYPEKDSLDFSRLRIRYLLLVEVEFGYGLIPCTIPLVWRYW